MPVVIVVIVLEGSFARIGQVSNLGRQTVEKICRPGLAKRANSLLGLISDSMLVCSKGDVVRGVSIIIL